MRESKKTWSRTISEDLHETWKRLKRKKDPDAIAEKLGVSRPVIDRALLYGYVSIPELVGKINKFFEDRLNAEKAEAQRLNQLADQVEAK